MAAPTSTFVSTIRLGDTEISLILEGSGPYPVELNVPEAAWRPEVPEASADGMITLASGGAFIRHRGSMIVVDPGLDEPGAPISSAVEQVFAGWTFTPGFQAALDALGVENDAVTHVVITHAHFDHCLGVTTGEGSERQPRFPNARYLLGREDWDMHFEPDGSMRPAPESRFSGVTVEMRSRLKAIMDAGLLDLLDGDSEPAPGVRLAHTPGESPGHRAMRVETGAEPFWLLGDLAHYAVEFTHIDWLTPTRRDAAAMAASRERVLPVIADEGALVTWSHAEFPGWGRIARTADGFAWQPLAHGDISD